MNATQLRHVEYLKNTVRHAPYGSVECLDAVEKLFELIPDEEIDAVFDDKEATD